MNKTSILAAFFCILLLSGCAKTDNPYRVDTVVRIPVDPTEATSVTAPAEPSETEAPTEAAESTEATEPPKSSSGGSSGKASSAKKPASSNKKPASDNKQESEKPTEQGSTSAIIGALKETLPKATEPAATVPETVPATEAVETVPPTEPPFEPSDYSPGSLDYAILEELNAQRTAAGLAELTMSKNLCGIAALRAREAAELWSHTRPDGRDYTSAMTDYGYSFSVSAENLAAVSGSGDGTVVVSKWINSDSQDKILSGSYTTAGVGVYRTGGVTYVVNLLVG